tara:strand:+ start:542 stop:655 length:114 start_codon:yes stop_codon:yes gene_type:complete
MNNNDIFVKAQGRAAMMAFVIVIASYTFTGQLIPGFV